jgi:DNA-binding NarL/FixJ family response regulator
MSVSLLIVDDTDHVRRMLVDILSLHGFEVVGEASDGEGAVAEAEETNPDVVVMDLRMTGTDGLEAARRIREARPQQHVVLYTAYLDSDVEQQAREIGVAVCIPKLSGVEALAREISALAMDLGSGDPA